MKKLVKFNGYSGDNDKYKPMQGQVAWFHLSDSSVNENNPVGSVEWENVEASMYWLFMAFFDGSDGDPAYYGKYFNVLEDAIFRSGRFSLCYFKELDSAEIVQWRLHGKICDL
jgi:hypothetical protein